GRPRGAADQAICRLAHPVLNALRNSLRDSLRSTGGRLARRNVPRGPSLALALLLGVLRARAAHAQDAPELSWRRNERPPESPQHFAFELRFGPYRPAIDEDFASSPGPYETVFGTDRRLYFGLELDWQALRIPKLGTLGAGFGWGYTRMGANARVAS